jgi:hypothetical protein
MSKYWEILAIDNKHRIEHGTLITLMQNFEFNLNNVCKPFLNPHYIQG